MEISFELSGKHGIIRGRTYLPKTQNNACLILCHGLTGDCHERPLVKIARALAANGAACILYDCTGSGDSDGESRNATVRSEVDDTLAVARYACTLKGVDAGRIVFGGHSLGALVAILAAKEFGARGLMLLSPALSCYHELIAMLTGERLAEFRKTGILDLGGFEICKEMVDELSDIDGYRIACELDLPTMLIHGDLDGDSPVYHSIRLKEKLGDKAELCVIADVHHCYETAPAQAEAARSAVEFMTKTI